MNDRVASPSMLICSGAFQGGHGRSGGSVQKGAIMKSSGHCHISAMICQWRNNSTASGSVDRVLVCGSVLSKA